jgi:hypothetical protein
MDIVRPCIVLLLLLCGAALSAGDAAAPKPEAPKAAEAPEPARKGKDGGARAARVKLFKEAFLDHFVMGVCAPKEWHADVRQNNGATFEFSNDYLSGGVGHDTPWFFKYSNFVENRMLEDKALGMGAWFTWYMLSQSKNKNGLTYNGTGPAKTAPANAKDPALMKDYFEWFKKTLIEANKHPEVPCVFQIEPDEWCHLLLSAGLDPAKVDIKIGSCGMEDLKGLPDNEIGYAQALARLRDRYAPMVILATNPSGWDWQNSMSGAKMGAAFKQMCGDDYELAAFEFSDRDKGAPGSGKLPPYGDASGICQTFPNHLQWIKEFHETTGMWVCMWQVALGNTFYATCNNSTGHYCDNLAQFILEGYPKNDGIARYVAAGCCGWMFNSGQGGTQVYDAAKDGITNPSPLAGTAGKKSTFPDDDGGFMRVFGGKYYAKPYPILGKRRKPEVSADVAAAPAPKPQLLAADAATMGTFCDRLRARLREELAGRRHPKFTSSRLHAQVTLEETSDNGVSLMMDGSRIDLPWSGLDKEDLVQLAVSQVRQNHPDDHALAAFFLFLVGRNSEAEDHLSQAIGFDDEVRRSLRPQ